MKKLLALIIASCPFLVLAQTTEIKPIPLRDSKWKFGICFSPDYSYRTLKASASDTIASWIAGNRDEREVAKFGYTVGLDARYQISRRLGLSLGLQYSNKGYKEKTRELGPDPFTTEPNYITSVRLVHAYHYIDLPLMLNVTAFSCGKLSLTAGAGLTSSILLASTSRSYIKYADGSAKSSKSSDKVTDYNNLMLAATVNLGLDYKLTQKSLIRVAPTYRHGITTIIDAPINGFLWSYGLNVGYYRSL